MEAKNRISSKSAFLLIFLLSSVFLVIGVWVEGLSDQEPSLPGHIRPTLAIPTSQGFELTLTANPDEHGNGEGRHSTGGKNRGTPTPTTDWMNYPTEDLPADLRDE